MAFPIGGGAAEVSSIVSLSDPSIDHSKRLLRERMRQELANLGAEAREMASRLICRRVVAALTTDPARVVLGFLATPSEPDILPALRAAMAMGRTVCLPRWAEGLDEYEPAALMAEEQLARGPFGVQEPPPANPTIGFEQLDLVLVPGLAFDRMGRRLGRGKGFLDRLLNRARRARRWGVAFDLQLIDAVPAAPHDANLDVVVTPTLWLPVSGEPR
jgi:5-formyltetrahydrofolate cyclo-ligase